MDRGSFSSSKGSGSMDFDSELTLSDKLKVFKSTNFDPQSYVTNHCGAMSEKVKKIYNGSSRNTFHDPCTRLFPLFEYQT